MVQLNSYAYLKNNPFRYIDPDGRFVFAIPLVFVAFGGTAAGITISTVTATQVASVVLASALLYSAYKVNQELGGQFYVESAYYDHVLNSDGSATQEKDKTKESDKQKGIRHTPDQEALNDIAKTSEKKGISNVDVDTVLEWAKEYNFPSRDDRGKQHWVGGEHIHLGGKHIPVRR